MIEDLFAIQYIALAFAGVIALLWIVLELSRKPPAKPREKARIFACGVDATPDKLNVPSESYYDYMKRFFRTRYLSAAHSGKLSHYVSWIIVGLAVIMAMLVMLW
jgi:hypothetical protein